jgi:hypothetical protein
MGVFDWPAPLFARVDALLAPLPPAVRLCLWAAVAAALSMGLYVAISPQQQIVAVTARANDLRRELRGYDGDFHGAWALIRSSFAAAGYRLLLVIPAALVASVPLIMLIVWISTAYGHYFPAAPSTVPVHVKPSVMQGRLEVQLESPHKLPPRHRVAVRGDGGGQVVTLPLDKPVPVLEKRHWWNVLIGNPAGYVPSDSPVERIDVALPRHEMLSFGPHWLRQWEALFIGPLILFSIAVKHFAQVA